MATNRPLVLASTRDLPRQTIEAWAQHIAQRLEAGDRVVTLFGRLDPSGDVLTTAVLERAGGPIQITRGQAAPQASFPSITQRWACGADVRTRTVGADGLVPEGHPWLKPVRHEGERQQHMAEYPFFSARGQEIHEVGVGPIHAGVIEPGHFRLMCHGEQVHHLELQLGYQHRGVEAQLLLRPALALAPLIETVAGDSSVVYVLGLRRRH